MSRTITVTLIASGVALFVGARYEGVQAMGIYIGFFEGAAVALLGLFYKRHAFLYRPERAFAATLIAFQAKLLFLVLGTLTFRYFDAAAAHVDWQAFAIAYTSAVVLLLPVGTWEAARVMGSTARRLGGEPTPQ